MKPQDELWWACLDGETTPAEAAQFDRTLTDEDHRLMSAEMEMERCLGEVLARPAPAADVAWRAALARVKAQEQRRRGVSRWRRRLLLAAVPAAIAATALVVFGAGHLRPAPPKPWFLSVSARELPGQPSPSQAKEAMATARDMLREGGMRMAFDPGNSLQAADAPFRLLSVRRNERAGETVVEMVFLCGAKPAKVIIAKDGGAVAREITLAAAHGAVLVSRPVGDWLVVAVGDDAPDRLLSLIQAAQAEPQGQSSPDSQLPQTEMSLPGTLLALPQEADPVPQHAVGAPVTAAVPEHAAGPSNPPVVPPQSVAPVPDASVAPPPNAVETPVVPPGTAVAAPQGAPNAVQQASPAAEPSKPTDTMI